MKKIILAGIMFMMFMGVVSASSFNGDYKGNPIVTIFSNSTEVKPDDVPAIIYNGRTMVPISTLKKLGIKVTWDQSDYSIDVKLPIGGTTGVQILNMELLQLNSKIQNNFYRIETLGETLNAISQSLSLGFDSINSNYKVSETLGSIDRVISNDMNQLSDIVSVTTDVVQEAIDNNIDIIVMKDILTSYSNALELYMTARDSLKDYSYSLMDSDFNSYLNDSSKAHDIILEAMYKANMGYNEYYKNVQN